ncbi:MAG: acyloxyacyl hydrolase [Chlamydiae bacterium]|nr:acyloxyacyl hydrolase [Chlamydiota bacterium]
MEGIVEYKFYPSFLKFHPMLGFMATVEKVTFTYGGVSLDLNLNKRVVFAPSFCAGYYTNGSGKDMGYPLEFRTGLEISLGLNDKSRVGILAYHTSNAKLGHRNPGTESLDLFYSFPIFRH